MKPSLDPSTDVHWLDLQLNALYRHDERGRLLSTREPGERPAPAFALSRSSHGNLWRFSASLSAKIVREVGRLASREVPLRLAASGSIDGPPPPERWEPMRRRLAQAGVAVEPEWRGPAFRFGANAAISTGAPRGMQRIAPASAEVALLRGGDFAWLADQVAHRQPVLVAEAGGAVIGAVWSARGGGPRGGPAVEAGVAVAPSHRAGGLGRALVAAWGRNVIASGRVPLYSTAWSNRASRALAHSLGLELFGENLHLG